MAIRKLIVILGLCFLTACNYIRESESTPAQLIMKRNISTSCELPEGSDFSNPEKVNQQILDNAVNCLELKLDEAFKKIKGKNPNEITINDLRVLNEKKVIDLKIKRSETWDYLAEAASLLHPEGKPILSLHSTKAAIQWLRQYSYLWLITLNKTDWYANPDFSDALRSLTYLLSNHYQLDLSHLISLIQKRDRAPEEIRTQTAVAQALWNLKSVIIPESIQSNISTPLKSTAIKQLLFLVAELHHSISKTLHWLSSNQLPRDLTPELEGESAVFSAVLENYLRANTFKEIHPDIFKWSLKNLLKSKDGGIAELAYELIRITQKLSPPNQIYYGLHPIFLLKLIKIIPKMVSEVMIAKDAFSHCQNNEVKNRECKATHRNMKSNPVLKHLVLKTGKYEYFYQDKDKAGQIKRWDHSLYWHDVIGKIALQNIESQIFLSFANNRGLLPLTAVYEDDLKETLDLAYTLLRFASINLTDKKKDDNYIEFPNQVSARPGTLAKLMGLIGDSWIESDKNNDGFLDVNEFFGVTELYNQIQQSTVNSVYQGSPKLRSYYLTNPKTNPYYWMDRFFDRRNFLENLNFKMELPHIQKAFDEIPVSTANSLKHALIEKKDNLKPKTLYYEAENSVPHTFKESVQPTVTDALLAS
jgi:hypothetical protein